MATTFPDAVPGKGLLVSSAEEIDFGTGVTRSASITASLVNVGDVPLTITGIRMTNTDNGIKAEKSGCSVGEVLSPLDACPLTLTWEPVREGAVVDDIQVSHTGARGILVMPLRGSATKPVNRDNKAIMLGDRSRDDVMRNIQPLSMDDLGEEGDDLLAEDDDAASAGKASGKTEKKSSGKGKASSAKDSAEEAPAAETSAERSMPQIDVRGILDGYMITSYSPTRAIISGPGGSRVVYNGEQAVIGGVLWSIVIRPSAVEFQSGDQKVLLLFDRSLSSINLLDTQSNGGVSTSATQTAPTTTTSSSTTSP